MHIMMERYALAGGDSQVTSNVRQNVVTKDSSFAKQQPAPNKEIHMVKAKTARMVYNPYKAGPSIRCWNVCLCAKTELPARAPSEGERPPEQMRTVSAKA